MNLRNKLKSILTLTAQIVINTFGNGKQLFA